LVPEAEEADSHLPDAELSSPQEIELTCREIGNSSSLFR
jgi:hypothetical protein